MHASTAVFPVPRTAYDVPRPGRGQVVDGDYLRACADLERRRVRRRYRCLEVARIYELATNDYIV